MKHFFIIANPFKDPELETAKLIGNFIIQAGGSCNIQVRGGEQGQNGKICRKNDNALQQNGGARDQNSTYTDTSEIPPETECILVLGGDGTLIEAARDTSGLNIPLLGINLGSLGFLAEVEKAGVTEALTRLLSDSYQIESRMMLTGWISRGGRRVECSHALNDIVITRSGSLQIIHFHIYVNGQFLNEYSADGVILSTPTGSTGYNMSAGGPIVEPSAKLIVITPICPHTLNARSIVLSAEDEIVIEMAEGKKDAPFRAEVNFDGGHASPLTLGDKVIVTRSERTTDIIKLSQASFLEVLHKKMSEK